MKRILSFVLALAAFGVAASSCSDSPSTPGAAAKQYTRWMADGEYDKFLDAIYFSPETTPEKVAQSKEMLRGLLDEKAAASLAEKGGLTSIEVLSEEISEDGTTAEVELLYVYGDGDTSEESMNLRLDGGRWLIEMSK